MRYSAVEGFERQLTALKVFEKPLISLDLLTKFTKNDAPQHILKKASFALKNRISEGIRRAMRGQLSSCLGLVLKQ